MKPTERIAGKGGKHDKRHKNAKLRKQVKLDKHVGRNKNVNRASLAFAQIQRSLGGMHINHASLPASDRLEDLFMAGASPVSGVGKRLAKPLDNGRDVSRVPPSSWRTSLVGNPLIRPIPWPYSDEGARPTVGRRSGAARREFWTRLGDEIWRIDVTWKTVLSAGYLAEDCVVIVHDWYTQKPLSSGHIFPCRAGAAVAYLERLSKRKGVPHTVIMDHQPQLSPSVQQWAFARGVMVVICQPSRSLGGGPVQ
ncbi:hypothetical protein [Paraburkholderia phenazinium]|uniref:Integrase catalytic domain-containing protein n=1 Tax=Paraburkholderia phenazinium TaxID=60549 RepID=A0A1N6JP06_9BURK|nr:hypothetical protein [Paraburkholderia phenazinium]SIO45756.1 hypothetical protein SAMN05444168_4703 [Paraburkholderia phenazinium]